MIRQTAFLASSALYAVDLSGLKRSPCGHTASGEPLYRYDIPAVWFKRRKGVDAAQSGYLWTYATATHLEEDPAAARNFLATELTDGRYGGQCLHRWDGERLWSEPSIPVAEQPLAFLRDMLAAYPEIPDGYDGWWRFPKRGEVSRG